MKSVKIFIVALAAASAIVALPTAKAEYLSGWERPIQTAEMKVIEATGLLADSRHVDLTLTRQDGSPQATGAVLMIDGRSVRLHVTRMEDAGCGSTRVVFSSIQPGAFHGGEYLELELIDHSTRVCRDFRPYQWEASASLRSHRDMRTRGTLQLVGNSIPVFTTMNDGL